MASDGELVTEAAAALDLTEFDLFRLAYRRWHGHEPDPRALERSFADYMLRDTTPVWVRWLSREALKHRDGGDLEVGVQDFGAHLYRDRPARPPFAGIYLGAFLVAWLILFTGLLNLETPRPSDPLAAPCVTGFFSDWAATLTGQALACARPFLRSEQDG